MSQESGMSLIEMMGVMAITGVMAAGAIVAYNTVRTRQARIIATEDMRSVATNAKLLFAGRDNYNGISADYLMKAGALRNDKSPIPGTEFSVYAEPGLREFALVFNDVDFKTCSWIVNQKFDWASGVGVNGYRESPGTYCRKVDKNEVSVFVK
jgi:prepilin-type N-terminal cleavage/methylation domain-containing protein